MQEYYAIFFDIVLYYLLLISSSSTQVYFMDLAAAEYPESIDFASSFNSIFANVGISLGSFTAAQAAGLTGIASTPYFGGVYSLLSCLLMLLVCRQLAAKK